MKTDAKQLLTYGYTRINGFAYIVDGQSYVYAGEVLPTYTKDCIDYITYTNSKGKIAKHSDFKGHRVGSAQHKLAAILATEAHPRAKAIKDIILATPGQIAKHTLEKLLSHAADGIVDLMHGHVAYKKLYVEKLKAGDQLVSLAYIDVADDMQIAPGDVLTVDHIDEDNYPVLMDAMGKKYTETSLDDLRTDYRLIYKLKVTK